MYKTVLIPVSGKNGLTRAKTALTHAHSLASGDIVLLHVFEPLPQIVGGEAHAELLAEQKAKGQTLLNSVMADSNMAAERVRCRVDEGTPAETIIRVAHEENADLIIMFTDGRDGLQDMLLGSVTERVLRNTDTALMVIRR
ncbi:MAG: universal stress protein [Desulfovibrio sp.]|uniref:universal stress protein n=1 Tax=Desulfovibrio sp. TaxID=885 RepID=UPI00135E69CE|nr:universal stress protein [Desulfovibrio sp.]MTJ92095.1 universal stress protein [Desulfovibrio sp.]